MPEDYLLIGVALGLIAVFPILYVILNYLAEQWTFLVVLKERQRYIKECRDNDFPILDLEEVFVSIREAQGKYWLTKSDKKIIEKVNYFTGMIKKES